MERKTKVNAEEDKHDLVITREFDLPVKLLFRAYIDPEIFAQWMGTKVLKFDSRKHGSYQFETSDPQGNVAFLASGVIHELIPDRKIIRTFEMEKMSFGVQLEVLDFERLSDDTSRLVMHVVYESVGQRDQVLQLPFAYGVNMAHDRLQATVDRLRVSGIK